MANTRLIGPWKRLVDQLDPVAMNRRLVPAIKRANGRIGRKFVGNARRMIRARRYAENSPMTIFMKGSSKPLVDSGQLYQSITYAQPDPFKLQVGVMRAKSGGNAVNIAAVLHEGAVIRVTSRMRAAFFAKMAAAGRKAPKRRFRGKKAQTSAAAFWNIPARPFLVKPLNEAAFIAFARDEWVKAVKKALFPNGASTK